MFNFWRDSKLAKQQGNTLLHPYNLGFKRNFQVSACLCLIPTAQTLVPSPLIPTHFTLRCKLGCSCITDITGASWSVLYVQACMAPVVLF